MNSPSSKTFPRRPFTPPKDFNSAPRIQKNLVATKEPIQKFDMDSSFHNFNDRCPLNLRSSSVSLLRSFLKKGECEQSFEPLFFYHISEQVPSQFNELKENTNQYYISRQVPSQVNELKENTSQLLLYLGEIRAVFLGSSPEKTEFLISKFRDKNNFEKFQVAFSEKNDCLYFRNNQNFKEKKVYIPNILEVEVLDLEFQMMTFHILNEALNESIENLHFHLLIIDENQEFFSFIQQKIQKLGKSIIYEMKITKNETLETKPNFQKTKSKDEKIIDSDGAVPSSPIKSSRDTNKIEKEQQQKGKFSKFSPESETGFELSSKLIEKFLSKDKKMGNKDFIEEESKNGSKRSAKIDSNEKKWKVQKELGKFSKVSPESERGFELSSKLIEKFLSKDKKMGIKDFIEEESKNGSKRSAKIDSNEKKWKVQKELTIFNIFDDIQNSTKSSRNRVIKDSIKEICNYEGPQKHITKTILNEDQLNLKKPRKKDENLEKEKPKKRRKDTEKCQKNASIPKKVSTPMKKKGNKKDSDWKRKTRETFIKSIQTLMRGFACKKYGLGIWAIFQPQNRRLVFSSNMESFAFVKTHVCHQNATKFFSIRDIVEIKNGRKTENFYRFKNDSENKERSFSIIMKSRTIDLEARNAQEKKEFCEALKCFLEICKECKD